MAKITLGKRPGSFTLTVSIPVAGSDEPDTLDFKAKYRTRKELAQLTDEHNKSSKARIDALVDRMRPKAPEPAPKRGRKVAADPAALPELPKAPSEEEFAQAINEGHADYILSACEGWELTDPFNREKVLEFVDQFPAAAAAFADAYNTAIKEGRLGN